jgi:CoA:oxalate CoA-transferase
VTFAPSGIKLVDISTGIAGPYASMLLSEQGADCIKVELPGGDYARNLPGFAVWNRSKKGAVIDYRRPEGREALYFIIEQADILIESFTPGEAKSLKLDYPALSRKNPRLIYGAIPSFGENGPLAEKKADEGLIAAYSGLYQGQGGIEQPPVYLTLPLASYGAAMLSIVGITSALYARESIGQGQKVETSLLAGALIMQAGGILKAEKIVPVATNRNIQQGVLPVYRLHNCADNQWIMIACGNSTFWNKLVIAIDRPELLADPRFDGAPWAIPQVENIIALTDIMVDIFSQKPREEWLKILAENDIPVAPVGTREEFMENPQIRHNNMIVEITDPEKGRTEQMGIPLTLTNNPGFIKGPAPRLGEHTNTILKEYGFGKNEIDKLVKNKIAQGQK